jgi:hypothetical protein
MTYQTTTGTMTASGNRTWSLLTAGDIEGREVIGLNDESIGTVGDLLVDYDEHTVRYATVDVGGFLGIGAKTVLVPFEKLQWSRDQLYLPVERDVLEQAPEFDLNATYDRDYEEQVGTVWGADAYWQTPGYGSTHSHWREGYDRTTVI